MADTDNGLRARLRRFFVYLALGFGAVVAGTYLSSWILGRLSPWLERVGGGEESVFWLYVLQALLARSWVLVGVPLVCLVAALLMRLRPLPTALSVALAGEAYVSAVWVVSVGFDGLAPDLASMVSWVLTTGTGVALGALLMARVRRSAQAREKASLAAAAARKAEYEAFLAKAQKQNSGSPPDGG